MISDKTLEYRHVFQSAFPIGGFSWSGDFEWIDFADKHNQTSPTNPVKSPTMPGGIFAIDREYFWHIGSYDDATDGGGGENLEMSFRVSNSVYKK